MKKSILLSAMVVVMVFMMAGGATFAYFSDSATNTGNTFTAGSVEIDCDRDMGDQPSTGPMFYNDPSLGSYPIDQWVPGSIHSRFLNVHNNGSLKVKLTKIKAEVSGLEGDVAAYQEFVNNMKLRVDFIIPNPFGTQQVYSLVSERPIGEYLGDGAVVTVPGLNNGASYIDKKTTKNYCFTAKLDPNAGNPLQGKSPQVTFTVLAEQANQFTKLGQDLVLS